MHQKLIACAAAVGLVAALTATPADAQRLRGGFHPGGFHGGVGGWRGGGWGWRGGGWGWNNGWGWGLAGLATGALIGSAIAGAPYGYTYPYGAYGYSGGYPMAGGAVYAGDAAAYCSARFRSYDPATGTYLGYDGRRHPCP
jgi:hypothetical protein